MPTADSHDDELDDVPGDDNSSDNDSDVRSLRKQLKDANREVELARKRQSGLNESIDKLKKANVELKGRLEKGDPEVEEELSGLRNKVRDLETNFKSADDERNTLKRDLTRLKSKDEAGKLITEKKYEGLLADLMSGDLKTPSDFDGNGEQYSAYLDRMAKRLGLTQEESQEQEDESDESADETGDEQIEQEQPKRNVSREKKRGDEQLEVPEKQRKPLSDKLRGATPSASARVSTARQKGRSVDQISDELMRLNPIDPKQAERYEALMAELNEATS